ncbi:DEAD/DEAH box RNA helicase [Phytophthora palmivora]|uniref:ATP-dependent RNA helicase n=1 Tax=Phytophthora palmivora TaxID=4796 RepID=A0A2P4XQH1_9STRA|nr:DEAD/DEAH box RNA helicase [Phytophthora palmivora]
MSGVSVVPYTVAPTSAAKPSKKRKKRSNASAADDSTSLMADGGWSKVDMEDMQIEGFQDGCAFELEELTDYRVETTADGGKMLVGESKRQQETNKKKRRKTKQQGTDGKVEEQKPTKLQQEREDDAPKKSKRKKNRGGKTKKEQQVEMVALKDVKLPKWNKFKLHPLLMQSLQTCGFSTPTRIQERMLLPALVDNRDVVGAAPTGSGKTLAFGLPILSQLLHEREQPGYTKDCKALILTPTRELAIQIQQHLEKMVRNREIGIVTLVGGMAVQKQKRILSYRPEIVIGTPGRLWDIIEANHEHMQDLATTLRFLVVDEADRMLQPGSYPELEKIFDVLRRKNKSVTSELSNLSDDDDDEEESENEDGNEGSEEEDDGEDIDMSKFASGTKVMMLDDVLKMQRKQQEKEKKTAAVKESEKVAKTKTKVEVVAPPRHVRQTFLFSATLTIPEGGRFQKSKTKKYRNALSVLERVMKRVGLRGKPAVVDLSIAEPDMGIPGAKPIISEETERKLKKQQENVALSLPAGLELCQHEVTESTRDSFLYYFLTENAGISNKK